MNDTVERDSLESLPDAVHNPHVAVTHLESLRLAVRRPEVGHRCRQKFARLLAVCERELQEEQDHAKALGEAWNQEHLRVGDHVTWGGEVDNTHPNSWSPDYLIKMVCRGIGYPSGSRGRECNRLNTATSSVAMAADDGIAGWIAKLKTEIVPCDLAKYLMLRLAGDATPVHLRFGPLADVIATSARYWHKENEKSGWTLMSKAASSKLMLDQKRKAGVFEVYCVMASLHWHAYLEGKPVPRDIHVHCMPRILQDGRSSTPFNATFRCVPELSWEDICNICKLNTLTYFAICVASDECPAMLRCETELADKVKQHNAAHIPTRTATPILLVIIACLFHLAHMMVMRALGKKQFQTTFILLGHAFR